MQKIVRINPADNVVVALRSLAAGETLDVPGFGAVTASEDIPQGHKMAISSISARENIIKYGLPIGHAERAIAPGEHVHTERMATNLSGTVEYTYQPAVPELDAVEPETVRAYRRSDGRVGIRNEVWIIPTVGCVNEVAQVLARDAAALVHGSVDGVVAFSHPFGCSQTGADHAQTRKLLAALAHHPNAGGVLVLGLGCENLTREQFVEELGDFDPDRIRFLTCQDVEDELAEGVSILSGLIDYAAKSEREPVSVGELVIGMKCGGSDGLSGITANPVIGRVSDMLVARGGTSILTEVPEMFGAESILLSRCRTREIFDQAAAMLNGFKDYFLRHGEVVYENPSPGNKAGGITTLEEKSCGCVQKGGAAPICGVLGYGKRVREHGLNLLCGPGNDLVSATALAAAGAHLVLFSTGRGTPFGSAVPTCKVFTNTALSARKPGWMDFNAGVVADGARTIDEAAGDLFQQVIAYAEGKKTVSERAGYRGIAIWKDGVTL